MDASLFALSFWLAYELRSSPLVIDLFRLPPIGEQNLFESYVWLYLLLIPAAPLMLEWQGFYTRPMLCPRRDTAWALFKGCLFMTVGLTLVLFFFRMYLARWVIVWFGGISFVLVFAKEELFRLALKSKFAQAQYRRRFILVGTPGETARMRKELTAAPPESLDILAELSIKETPVERLVQMLHDYSVNGVILSAKDAYFEQIEALVRACELEGVEAWLIADFFTTQFSRTSFDDFYGRPVMVFRTVPEASWQSLLKLVMDYVLAAVALTIFAAPAAVTALIIKLTSPGPIFFRQQRAGLNGHPFTMYKFRTMVSNAEQLKAELAQLNEMSGPVFKVTNDPRVTRFGRWLRKSSFDEFPQLLNVLRGEMSLVGPRPLPVDEVKRFDDPSHRRRLSVRPGLTCLWQVSGRNNVTDFAEWVRLDLEYIDNWSLWLDMKILLRTVPIVLVGTGAR